MMEALVRTRILGLMLSIASTVLSGCGDDTSETSPGPVPKVEKAGPHPVGNATFTVNDATRMRELRVEVWYPAADSARDAADEGQPITSFASGADRDALAGLLETAPDPATNRRAHSARDAASADGTFAVVAFSHCYNCTRFSTFTIAERLASHGIIVLAPDHTGGTLFDKLAGTDAPLDTAFLEIRKDDLRFTLDRALDASATELPESVRGKLDPARVGVFGHSFGAVTAGLLLMDDARPKAGLALAAPMENPLLPGVTVTEIEKPLFFWLAKEDNSITEVGNDVIRSNFASAKAPAWKVEVADNGHWSVSDICGITPDFDAGCNSSDVRQTTGEAFTYHDIEASRGIAASYVTAFFLATLTNDADARAYLEEAHPAELVDIEAK